MSEYGKICGEIEVLNENGDVVDRVNNMITRRGLHWLLAVGFGVRGAGTTSAATPAHGDQVVGALRLPSETATGGVLAANPLGLGNPLAGIPVGLQAGAARRYSTVFGGPADEYWINDFEVYPAMVCPFQHLVLSTDATLPSFTRDTITIAYPNYWSTLDAANVNVSWFVDVTRFGLLITHNYVAGTSTGTFNSVGFVNVDGVGVRVCGAYALLTTPINAATDTRTINYRLFVNT